MIVDLAIETAPVQIQVPVQLLDQMFIARQLLVYLSDSFNSMKSTGDERHGLKIHDA